MVTRRPSASTSRTRTAPAKKAAAPAPAPVQKAAPTRKPASSRTAKPAVNRGGRPHKDAVQTAAPEIADVVHAPEELTTHPLNKQTVTAHDVVRAFHTAMVFMQQYMDEYAGELGAAAEFVTPVTTGRRGNIRKDGPARQAKADPAQRVVEEWYDIDEVKKMGVVAIRELAADLREEGFPITEPKLKKTIIEQMEKAGLFREGGPAAADEDDAVSDDEAPEEDSEDFEDEVDEADEESDGDDEGDGEEFYSRDELEAMTLKQLQREAEEEGITWKGLDKEELVEALLGDEEDEDDGEEEEAVREVDPDDFPDMDIDELLEIATSVAEDDEDFRLTAKMKKSKDLLVTALTEYFEDQEEDDEDE